jgi:hypothetical protein
MEITLFYKPTAQIHQITCTDENELNSLVCALFGIKLDTTTFTLNNKNFNFKDLKEGDLVTIDKKKKELENLSKPVNNMIYINGKYEEHSFRILVDSGAQANFMSYEMATFLGLDSHIDKRYGGEAQGVGTSKIYGKIHECKIKLGNKVILPMNFMISDVAADKYIVLLGLEVLYAYDCNLNFRNKQLVIGDDAINFLSEEESSPLPVNYVKHELLQKTRVVAQNRNYAELIKRIIENIIKNPTEEKYRKINSKSKLLSDNDICLQFLSDIGFSYIDDKNMLYNNQLQILKYVKEFLSQ